MTNTPNHRQTAAISRQLSDAASGKMPEDWYGNSYRSTSYEMKGRDGYSTIYVHWSTPIARFVNGYCEYFDASYHSATTRSFQGRILAAMSPSDPLYEWVRAELGKPTGERGRIFLDTEALAA